MVTSAGRLAPGIIAGMLFWSGMTLGAGLPPVSESRPIGAPPPPPDAMSETVRQPGQPDTSLEGRVARLERQLDSQVLIEMMTRLQAMQMDLQELRGSVEMQGHKINSMEQRQRDLYVDIDRRMRQVETGGAAAPGAGQPQVAMPQVPAAPSAMPPVATPSGAAEADDAAAERVAYQQAFEHLQAGRYQDAVTGFRGFVEQFPESGLAANAQYWLGEAKYVMREFADAIEEFDKVLANHPNSGKVPDALLKLGFSHYEMRDWEKAGELLSQVVEEYPGSTASQLAENRLHQMRLEGR